MRVSEYAFQLPVHGLGDLLGIPADQLGQVAEWIRDYVRGTSPLSSPTQIERGKAAAAKLLEHAEAWQSGHNGLFSRLSEAADTNGISPDSVSANGIGFPV